MVVKCSVYLNRLVFVMEQMLDTLYPNEPQLNKTNTSDTEAQFLNLNLSLIRAVDGMPLQIPTLSSLSREM